MAISMYQASVPVFIRMLASLRAVLEKGAAHAAAKKFDPAALLHARLAPDMFPLTRQVQTATDNAKGCAARLAGVEIPRYEDTEATFSELVARVNRTIGFLESLEPKEIDGSEEREIVLKLRNFEQRFKGLPYLLHFALPNFMFHVVTAYAILRHSGVDLGKTDFLGPA